MTGHVIDRADGRTDGEHWDEEFDLGSYRADICIVMVSTQEAGYGPRLHQHPYPETFVIQRGSARFTIGDEELIGRAGQVIVVPAQTPHTFRTLGPYEAVDIYANDEVIIDWLE
ncbi:cupin domain-containing protein [Nesterenkonia sp. CL21]|uniref:cupin domain-containing protein n=1 Tax=Nesterenkonia sp. CL21 TaxID=3064894 RepID=UPI002878A2B9|nr:cupin domain-containing protein [Nesterenkonia sp. CL21]MDS2171850.1 cupin domain-containing protein [Nesterenkonia sp. CL21]